MGNIKNKKKFQEKFKTVGLMTDYIEAVFNQLNGFPTARVPYHTLEICKWTAIAPNEAILQQKVTKTT